jgi:hypothetical protein
MQITIDIPEDRAISEAGCGAGVDGGSVAAGFGR